MNKVLVVCIGNDFVGDDGAGKVVYERLQQHSFHSEVRLVFLGLGGIDLIEQFDGEELLVVVDAVQLDSKPGTVHVLNWDQLPHMGQRPVSGHGIGIREAIIVAQKLYPEKCPSSTYLIGIEGSCYNQLGAGLSQPVVEAIPLAVEKVLTLIGEIPKCSS